MKYLKLFGQVSEYEEYKEEVLDVDPDFLPNLSYCNNDDVVFVSDENENGITLFLSNGTSQFIKYDDGIVPTSAFTNRTDIIGLKIGNGITHIGDSAFLGCTKIVGEVAFPNSVKTIGEYAFYDCNEIQFFKFGKGINSIGECAFDGTNASGVSFYSIENLCNIDFAYSENGYSNPLYYANNLYIKNVETTNVVIPNSITKIGNETFIGANITSVTIPDSVTEIGTWAFAETDLKSITIPSSVTSIGDYAFSDCRLLSGDLIIPENVTYLGEYAFWGAKISSVTIPSSITVINSGVFGYCNQLKEINIPEGITSIGVSSFNTCTSVTSLTMPNTVTSIGNSAFHNLTSLKEFILSNNLETIGDYAFQSCSAATSDLFIPSSVTSIGDKAFERCTSVHSIRVDSNNQKYTSQENGVEKNVLIDIDAQTLLLGCNSSELPSSFAKVANYAFWNCTGLTSINLPSDLTQLGINAFQGCTNATGSIIIPTGVTSVPNECFKSCASISSIIINDNVTSIGYQAFYYCTSATSLTIGSSVTSIAQDAFYNCANICNELVIPSATTYIGPNAFLNVSRYVPSIVVEEGNTKYTSRNSNGEECNVIISIDTNTLILGCSAATIPSTVTTIGGNAFRSCYGLRGTFTIPEGVVTLMAQSFYNCTMIAELALPNTLQTIEGGAMSTLSNLTAITIPSSVTSIANNAIISTPKVESIVVDQNNTTYNSFNNCNAIVETTTKKVICGCKNTDLSASNIEAIDSYAFYGHTELTNIHIPSNITSIASLAFRCINVTAITVDSSNVNYYSSGDCLIEKKDDAYSVVVGCKNSVVPNEVKKIGSNSFAQQPITSITLPVNTTSLLSTAFSGCTSLRSITMNGQVTSIGTSCFNGCTSLTSITIYATVPPSIPSNAFTSVPSTCEINVPQESVTAYKKASGWSSRANKISAI